jgi:exopolysaccharide biosynthesis polyprenyl glycosylphosphotransferase
MSFRQGQLSLLFLNAMDLGLLLTALAAAIILIYAPAAQTGVTDYSADFLVTRIKLSNALLGGALLIGWHFAFKAYGLYHSYRLRRIDAVIGAVLKAVGVCSLSLLVAAQLGGWRTITPTAVIVFYLVAVALVSGLRIAVYRGSRVLRRRGINNKTLLVIGGGTRAHQLIEVIGENADLGYRIIGFLDSGKPYRHDLSGVPWLGGFEELPRILNERVIDDVAIALPIKSQYDQIKAAIDKLEEQGIGVHLMSDFFPQHLATTRAANFHGMPLLSLTSAPPFCWRTEVKRIVDLIGSATMLIISAPLLIVAAILIRLDSKGPIFFVQERMGYNKRRFQMIKFRTMAVDAEARMQEIEHLNEKDGPIFKIKNDPRITRFGRFLRKFSIDELPQLFNVFLGDMSLVGPRPLSIRDALRLEESWQKRRFSVKPGLTCLWQISGRSNLSFEEWVELDLEYIDTWSLQLDWWIMLRTVPAVIGAKGAV